MTKQGDMGAQKNIENPEPSFAKASAGKLRRSEEGGLVRRSLGEGGFTLLEAIISVGIISILTVMLTNAFPLVREQQQLKITKELFASQLRRAQQLALNESREKGCLDLFRDDESNARHCSDIGIAIRNRELITFADTVPDNSYTPARDYIVGRIALPNSVESTQKDFLYKATPPNITVYVDGTARSLNSADSLQLRIGSRRVNLNIFPYGYVEEL